MVYSVCALQERQYMKIANTGWNFGHSSTLYSLIKKFLKAVNCYRTVMRSNPF